MSVLYLWPLVLVAAFAYDLAVARYVVAVEGRRSVRAGVWSVLTYLVGIIGTLSIVKVSQWLILPECIGLFLGTVVGVSFKEEDEDEDYVWYSVECHRGRHLDPCLDPKCWSNGPDAARERIKKGWYERR